MDNQDKNHASGSSGFGSNDFLNSAFSLEGFSKTFFHNR